MGLMGFLKFALLCIDFLAWPIFALGYPLCASIRAIETGSKYHMRKLVIYWTLFSLISLFEVVFAKIIEWIPFWSCIKLTLICWLVIPQFNGAIHAYETLVCPCMSVNSQAVMSWLSKSKEEKPLKPESFLDEAEKYIKENGSEALEKLIASKLVSREPNNSQRYTRVEEPEEKIAVARSDQPKEAGDFQKEIKISEAWEKIPSTEAKQVQQAELSNVVQSEKEMAEVAEVKEMTRSETNAENRHPETSPLRKVRRQWKCALCLVTTTSGKTLNQHLQGSKHKSMFESLKANKNNTKNTPSSPSTTDKSRQGNPEAVKSKAGNGAKQKSPVETEEKTSTTDKSPLCNPEAVKSKAGNGAKQKSSVETKERVQFQDQQKQAKSSVETKERVQFQDQQKQAKQKKDGVAVQQFKLWCTVCNVKLLSEVDLSSHLQGKRHSSNIEKLVKS